jgi:hypothetical protein
MQFFFLEDYKGRGQGSGVRGQGSGVRGQRHGHRIGINPRSQINALLVGLKLVAESPKLTPET